MEVLVVQVSATSDSNNDTNNGTNNETNNDGNKESLETPYICPDLSTQRVEKHFSTQRVEHGPWSNRGPHPRRP